LPRHRRNGVRAQQRRFRGANPAKERAKKLKSREPPKTPAAIPAKTEIYFYCWNKRLHGTPISLGRRCGKTRRRNQAGGS